MDTYFNSGVKRTKCNLTWAPARGAPHPPYSYSNSVSFDIPLARETLLFFSQGGLTGGSLTVTSSANISDIARVDITVHYHDRRMRDQAEICVVKRNEGENGVGIYTHRVTPPHNSFCDELHFEVVLTIPCGTPDETLYLNRLETHVSTFSQYLEPLAIDFGDLILNGRTGEITVKTIIAHSAYFKTHTGSISAEVTPVCLEIDVRSETGSMKGIYMAARSLCLITNTGKVNVDALLTGSEGPNNSLNIHTRTGPLIARILLGPLDTPDSYRGNNFAVTTKSSNGSLIVYITSPPDSVLTVDASTRTGSAILSLSPQFEGYMDVYSAHSVGEIEVSNTTGSSDGRRRVMNTTQRETHWGRGTAGSVFWEANPVMNVQRPMGNVVLETWTGPATICL
ncbi:hypothetical protein FB45DRAFT_1050679 [Roridomyces roridus]|uniref:Uncharacterized protein n=1 Tax=Roridomyces roridus TaxID=1738132 RepID=A0AAD7CKH5_9AGAR|nr:hypothetical protein FB45DRAFT_1050679 [Roridomyces roridus]